MLFVAAAGNAAPTTIGRVLSGELQRPERRLGGRDRQKRAPRVVLELRRDHGRPWCARRDILSTTMGNTTATSAGRRWRRPTCRAPRRSCCPKCALNTAALKNNILNNVDLIASMSGITVTGGRLNVNKALTACNGAPPRHASGGPDGSAGNRRQRPGDAELERLVWSHQLQRQTRDVVGRAVERHVGNTPNTNFTDNTAVNGTTYYYVVTALNNNGESGNSNQASATPSAPPAIRPRQRIQRDRRAGQEEDHVDMERVSRRDELRVYRSPNGSMVGPHRDSDRARATKQRVVE